MKVTVKDLSTGKNKAMDSRFAGILVKMKRAEYVVENKVLIAEPVIPEKKKRGRKKKTYETKVMEADV